MGLSSGSCSVLPHRGVNQERGTTLGPLGATGPKCSPRRLTALPRTVSNPVMSRLFATVVALGLSTVLLAAPPATETTLRLKVTSVHDGDTLAGINEANEQVKVRLDAVDAPELSQPYGQALADKVFGKSVTVTTKKRDQYGRVIGHVIVGKRDVNLELLEEGAVWHYEKYDRNKRLREAAQGARTAKKGLWREPDPVAPWDWRKTERERKGK